jgi:hypothetical protein
MRCSPADFAAIVNRYGHTAIGPKQCTASAFLAGVLSVLSKYGTVLYHLAPATGRWQYNGSIKLVGSSGRARLGVQSPILI